jgi:protein disulfide-isomerase
MKKAILILFVAFSAINLQAQELEWETDISKAVSLSSKTKKPMLMFFTGSDWCGWCIRLQKEVLKTQEFAKWAKENVILVELDFPKVNNQTDAIKMQNAQLNSFFQVKGYPTVWFARGAKTKDGKISFDALGSTGYVAGGPSAWLAGANKIINNK